MELIKILASVVFKIQMVYLQKVAFTGINGLQFCTEHKYRTFSIYRT